MILVKHYNIIICHNVLYSYCGLLFIKVTRNENIFTISKYYFHYILDIYSDLSDNTVVIHLLSINPFPYPLSIFLAIYIYPSSIYPCIHLSISLFLLTVVDLFHKETFHGQESLWPRKINEIVMTT